MTENEANKNEILGFIIGLIVGTLGALILTLCAMLPVIAERNTYKKELLSCGIAHYEVDDNGNAKFVINPKIKTEK